MIREAAGGGRATYLSLDVLGLVLVVVRLHALLQFLDELLLGVLVWEKKGKRLGFMEKLSDSWSKGRPPGYDTLYG